MAAAGKMEYIEGVVTGASLITQQYHFVKLNTSGVIVGNTSAAAICQGVLQDKPLSGAACQVAYSGISKIVLGATVTAGVAVTTDDEGRAVAATAGQWSNGFLLEGGAIDEIGSILLGLPYYIPV